MPPTKRKQTAAAARGKQQSGSSGSPDSPSQTKRRCDGCTETVSATKDALKCSICHAKERLSGSSRCCLRVLFSRTRFYSKRLFLGALASELAGLPTSQSMESILSMVRVSLAS